MKCNLLISLFILVFLQACSGTAERQDSAKSAAENGAIANCTLKPSYASFLAANQDQAEGDVIKIQATGYGAPPKKYYPQYQRRLMAMRASRVEAYRNLAEMLNGVHVSSGTTVGEMVISHDSSRLYVDGYVSGARTVSLKENEDSSFEMTLEAVIDEAFYAAVLQHQLMAQCGSGSGQGSLAMHNKDSRANNFYYSE